MGLSQGMWLARTHGDEKPPGDRDHSAPWTNANIFTSLETK